jgi:MORN repeat variant
MVSVHCQAMRKSHLDGSRPVAARWLWGGRRTCLCLLLMMLSLTLAPGLAVADAPLRSDDVRISRAGPLWLLDGKPFSGQLQRVDSDGAVALLPLDTGLLHGELVSRYRDGSLRGRGHYVRGQAHGLQRAWWPNGQLQSEQFFAGDRPHGSLRTWYASGQRYQEHHYVQGQESGPQRVWFEDQKLRANYEVRNGRRYGSIGMMNCVGGDRALALALIK